MTAEEAVSRLESFLGDLKVSIEAVCERHRVSFDMIHLDEEKLTTAVEADSKLTERMEKAEAFINDGIFEPVEALLSPRNKRKRKSV